MTVEETYKELKRIKGKQYSVAVYNLATILVPVGFAPLFEGGVKETLVSAAVGCILAFLITLGKKIQMSSFILNAICAFGVAVTAACVNRVTSGWNLDIAIISLSDAPGARRSDHHAIRDTLRGIIFRRRQDTGGIFDSSCNRAWSRYQDDFCRRYRMECVDGSGGKFCLRSLRFLCFWRHPENICGRRVWSSNRRRCLSALYTPWSGCGAGFFLFCAGDCVYGTSFARIFKAPVTVFLIAGILPIMRGAGMYRIALFYRCQ